MRNSRSVSIDNTPVVIESAHSIFFCHDGTGTTLVDSAPVAKQIIGNVAINGTTTNIWDNAGNFTPAGDHTEQHNTAAQIAYGDMTDTSVGVAQLVFFTDFFATAVPSTNFNTILMYGATVGGPLHRLTIEQTTGRMQLKNFDAAGVSNSVQPSGSACDSTRYSFVHFLDFVNGTLTSYKNGVLNGDPKSLDLDNIPGPQSRGWAMFSNMTSDSPSFNVELGSEGMTGCRINRVGIIRPQKDISAQIGAIALGLHEIEHELPRALHGI